MNPKNDPGKIEANALIDLKKMTQRWGHDWRRSCPQIQENFSLNFNVLSCIWVGRTFDAYLQPGDPGACRWRVCTIENRARFLKGRLTSEKESEMSKLTTEDREEISKGNYALPEERKYPIEDKPNDCNAKARAAQQEKAGNLSAADRKRIDAKADKVLGKD